MVLSADQREALTRIRARHGLPPKIEDPATLDRVMTIFRLVRARLIEEGRWPPPA